MYTRNTSTTIINNSTSTEFLDSRPYYYKFSTVDTEAATAPVAVAAPAAVAAPGPGPTMASSR